MKSTVIIDVDAPQKEVASWYADPSHNLKWRDDLARYELVSGKQGMPGSVYRLISKDGSMSFTGTLVRRLPNEVRLNLESENVTVEVHGVLRTLTDGRTRLISKEDFKFKGVWNKAFGLLSRPSIRKTHRKQLEAFKRFAEREKRANEPPPSPRPRKQAAKKRPRN